jgi:very-short-patch-repair endonuclease
MMPAEKVLWERLRKRQLGGFKFRRQHPIDPSIADFYCPASRLVIEVDGNIHTTQREKDEQRTQRLVDYGYRVLRVSNREVEIDPECVLRRILEACQGGKQPSPGIGRGAGVRAMRWYDQSLGRFIQPDTLVPIPGDPVAFDRYHYSRNSPLRYVDPSGHGYCNSDNAAEDVDCSYTAQNILEEFDGVTFENGNMQWTNEDISAVYMAVMAVGAKIGQVLRAVNDIVLTAGEAFQGIYGNVTFLRGNRRADGSTNGLSEECAGSGTGGCTSSSSLINMVSWGSTMLRRRNTAIHELGHAFSGTSLGRDAYSVLGDAMKNDPLLRRDNPLEGYSYGFASGYIFMNFQMSYTNASSSNEIFADMFVGWVTNAWFTGSYPPGWGVDMGDETATQIDMAEAKSGWINNYMKTTIP